MLNLASKIAINLEVDTKKGQIQMISDYLDMDIWLVNKDFSLTQFGRNNHSIGKDLPKESAQVIEEAFKDGVIISRSFGDLLDQPTITLAYPVTVNGSVTQVILIHQSVKLIDSVFIQMIGLLLISLVIGLLVSIGLAHYLSKLFVDPLIHKQTKDALDQEHQRHTFIANVSHELRTPITALLTLIEAVNDGVIDEADYGAVHHQLFEEVSQLRLTVNHMIDLTSMQQFDYPIHCIDVDLKSMIQDLYRRFNSIAKLKNKSIQIETNQSETLNTDYELFNQLLTLLIENAIKYANDDTTIFLTHHEHQIILRNQAPTLSVEELSLIRERFYRTNNIDDVGNGLGLAIVSEIVHLLVIEIEFESVESWFTVTIRY